MNKTFKTTTIITLLTVITFAGTCLSDDQIPGEWESLSLVGLAKWAQRFDQEGIDAEGKRRHLADFIKDKYANAVAESKVDWDQWLNMIVHTHLDLSEETQRAMAQGIQGLLFARRCRYIEA